MLFFVASKEAKLWRPCRMNNFIEAHTLTSFFAVTAPYATPSHPAKKAENSALH
jgi:hypothetical protein